MQQPLAFERWTSWLPQFQKNHSAICYPVNDDHVALKAPTNKHLKLCNLTIKTDQVKIILIDFHQSLFSLSSSLVMNQEHSLMENFHIKHLYDLLKRKFENQSKGFTKWLLARKKWLTTFIDRYSMKIEFVNDYECTLKWARRKHKNVPENDWLELMMVQIIDIRELYETNQEQFHSVEFWKPFQEEVWFLLRSGRYEILDYIPVEIFIQFKEWKEKLAHLFQIRCRFDFVFDLDDIDKAKKAISEKRCQMFQISKRLRDNEDFMKHATKCQAYNIQYASERLKKDRNFCLDVVSSNPDLLSFINFVDNEFALELLRITLSKTIIVDGKIQEEQIQTCVPQALNDDHVALKAPTNKHLKLCNLTIKTDQVKIILIDFHQSLFSLSSSLVMNQEHSLMENFHIKHLYDLLKRKFENQSKGFTKWLLARKKWLTTFIDRYSMKIEFVNDYECTLKWARRKHKNVPENDWLELMMVQIIDIRELYETNQEQFHSVEFWKPFQEEVWFLLRSGRYEILDYIPVEIFIQFKEWKEKLAHLFQIRCRFDFVFDLDDIDKAKKAISEKRCQMFQISKRLRDNEDFMKHATKCQAYNIQYASERLKKDRNFCLDVVSSNPDLLSFINFVDNEFALELLRITLSKTIIVDGKIQEEQIQTCVPQACDWLSLSFWETNISMDDKMKIFQLLFLKDSRISYRHHKDLMKSALQMLVELPDEYYQAHHNHQHTLNDQGKIYKDYDSAWKNDEKSFLKRRDLDLILKYGPMNLRKDRDFVLKVVKTDKYRNSMLCERDNINWEYIYPELQNDREIVLALMTRNGSILFKKEECGNYLVSEEFRNDREIILTALTSDSSCSFHDIPQCFHEDKQLILGILNRSRICYVDIEDVLLLNLARCYGDDIHIRDVLQRFFERKDEEVIFAALKKDYKYWKYLSDDLQNDREFLLNALRHNVDPNIVLWFALKKLKQDTTFMMDFVKAHPKGLDLILDSFNDNLCSEMAVEGVKLWGAISDKIFKVCLKQDPTTEISFDEALKFFKDLKHQRLEYEYFGCHIPESWLMKEKIKLPYMQNYRIYEFEESQALYDDWKRYLGQYALHDLD
ncbi:hypothetical protein FDP41_011618 [Naegleria fowleri]|uniref:DUF4116 domain-containing protein n=1 Tax=Naegleria fowleri TaxID=5763 RepID=A0A6A5CAL7_NAEFO|nr:uncharacterized protein FDP41_011618 [Naegleria fowleri]KAF0982688.1 hypothetical protein FDP41_011618 [Naegleria fowleri]